MKRNLLTLAVAGLALASCSNDETVNSLATSGANEISFRPLMTGMTRAADVTTDNLNAFIVTAFPTGTTTNAYFADETFTKQTSGTYTSASKQYWPASVNLDFYAWAPASVTGTYGSLSVTPGTTIGSQPDLIYARTNNWGKVTGSGTHDGANGVGINFRHAESKVILKIKNTDSNLKFTIENASICYVNTVGTFAYGGSPTETDTHDGGNLLQTNWTTNTTGNYVITPTDNDSYKVFNGSVSARDLTDAVATREMILLPQVLTKKMAYDGSTTRNGVNPGSLFTGPCIKVNLKIQSTSAGAQYIVGDESNYVTAMWPIETITWTPGYKYTYTLDLAEGGYYPDNVEGDAGLDPILAGSEIKFASVTIDGWDESNIDVAGRAFVYSAVAGGEKTINVSATAGGHFSITLTGIADSDLPSTPISVTTVGNIVGTPTAVRSGTTAYITGILNAGSSQTSTFTFTDGAGTPVVTTINIVQAAN